MEIQVIQTTYGERAHEGSALTEGTSVWHKRHIDEKFEVIGEEMTKDGREVYRVPVKIAEGHTAKLHIDKRDVVIVNP